MVSEASSRQRQPSILILFELPVLPRIARLGECSLQRHRLVIPVFPSYRTFPPGLCNSFADATTPDCDTEAIMAHIEHYQCFKPSSSCHPFGETADAD